MAGMTLMTQADGDCCCDDTFTPCSGSTRIFDPADYYLSVTISGGSFSSECGSCSEINDTFLLTWNAGANRYRYDNYPYGDYSSCGSPSNAAMYLRVSVSITCSGGLIGFRGGDTNPILPASGSSNIWLLYIRDGYDWDDSSNGTVCIALHSPSTVSAASSTITEGAVVASLLLSNLTDNGESTTCRCHMANGHTSNVATASVAFIAV